MRGCSQNGGVLHRPPWVSKGYPRLGQRHQSSPGRQGASHFFHGSAVVLTCPALRATESNRRPAFKTAGFHSCTHYARSFLRASRVRENSFQGRWLERCTCECAQIRAHPAAIHKDAPVNRSPAAAMIIFRRRSWPRAIRRKVHPVVRQGMRAGGWGRRVRQQYQSVCVSL